MVISFTNQKGGVGKSTLAYNLGAYAAKKANTLIIDLDPQGTVSKLLTDSENESNSSAKIFRGENPLALVETTTVDGLWIIKGTLELEKEMNTRNIGVLQSAIYTLQRSYDVIIIDTRPSVDTAFISAIKAADTAIIPIIPEVSSLYDLPNIMHLITNSNTHADIKFVINNMDKRIKSHSMISSTIRKRFNTNVPIIHSSADIKNSMMHRKPVFEYAPYSRVTRELNLLFYKLLYGGEEND